MAIRTVRLDDEAEATLRQIHEATGLPIFEALKQGLRCLNQQVRDATKQRPYDLLRAAGSRPGWICERALYGDAARRGYRDSQEAAEMILVDTGPLVALFDPQDGQHKPCRGTLMEIREPILTTTPVLTEAFRVLGPASIGSDSLREFVEATASP